MLLTAFKSLSNSSSDVFLWKSFNSNFMKLPKKIILTIIIISHFEKKCKSKRSDSDAMIEVSGRDQSDKEFMLSRNKETLCWELSGEKSPEYTESPEPVLEAIGGFINADNLIWEGTATELIEKLEPDIKPNVLSLKLNVNAGRLMNDYSIRYTNKRNNSGRMIFFSLLSKE